LAASARSASRLANPPVLSLAAKKPRFASQLANLSARRPRSAVSSARRSVSRRANPLANRSASPRVSPHANLSVSPPVRPLAVDVNLTVHLLAVDASPRAVVASPPVVDVDQPPRQRQRRRLRWQPRSHRPLPPPMHRPLRPARPRPRNNPPVTNGSCTIGPGRLCPGPSFSPTPTEHFGLIETSGRV
jgi:hypothetical protein